MGGQGKRQGIRVRRPVHVFAIVVLCALIAACGSRRDDSELLAAAGAGGGGGVRTGAAGGTGGGTGAVTGGLESSTAAPGATGGQGGTGLGQTATGTPLPGDGSGDGGGPSGGGAPGAPLVLGSVGTLSGPAGASLGPIPEGVQVWARWINDRGGVAGHPVQVVVADDGGDPARHRALVQEFVEQRGVVAFVGNAEALTGAGSVEYLTGAGVPVVGSEAAGQWFYESPVYFPQGSHGSALLQAGGPSAAEIFVPQGLTKLGIVTCVEVAICRDAYTRAPAVMAKYGMEVVYRAQASLGQPDFTAECLGARNAGAQVISLAMDANTIHSIARACHRQGYRPVFTWSAGSTVSDHATDPELEGSYIGTIVAPWTASGSPNLDDFQAGMSTYAPGTEPTGGHLLGWTSAKVFELGALAAADPANRAELLAGLGSLRGDLLPDLTGPLMFRQGQPAEPVVCQFNVLITGGKFTSGNGGKRSCGEFDPNL